MRLFFVFLVCFACASTTDIQPSTTSQASVTLTPASTPTSAPSSAPLAPIISKPATEAATTTPAATLPIVQAKPKKKLTPYQKCIKKRGAGSSGGRCPCFCAADGTVECSECITLPEDIR